MAELGVRNELAVENQRGADAGAQRGGDDEAILALRGAELLLGKTGGVSVVHHGDRTTASFEDLQTRFGELALLEVNRGGLNAGATNVNAECLCSLNHLQPLYQGMLWVYSNRYMLW